MGYEFDRPADGVTLTVTATIVDAAGNVSLPGATAPPWATPRDRRADRGHHRRREQRRHHQQIPRSAARHVDLDRERQPGLCRHHGRGPSGDGVTLTVTPPSWTRGQRLGR